MKIEMEDIYQELRRTNEILSQILLAITEQNEEYEDEEVEETEKPEVSRKK